MAAIARVWTPEELGMASSCCCYRLAAPRPYRPSEKFPISSSSSDFFTRVSLRSGKWKESLGRNLLWRTGTLGCACPPKKGGAALQPRALGGSSVGQKPYVAVMIVPTGTGASIGGFAGDALPVARALASVVDCLITHPNVLNGAMLFWPMANTLYVEGFALDRFAEGAWGLQPVHQNRVGLVLDSGIEEELQLQHLQVADAARATLGLPVLEYTVTDTPLQVEKWIDETTGTSTGRLGRPDSLLRAVDTLIKRAQVDAVAVVGHFPDDSVDELQDYRQGQGVDVLAGVEAVISHMVVKEFQIPCAHAPALAPLPFDPSISPRSAAEEDRRATVRVVGISSLASIVSTQDSEMHIGYTFLPCVLAGLSRAPQLVRKGNTGRAGTLWADDVDCVVVPADACGGDGTLALCHKTGHKVDLTPIDCSEMGCDVSGVVQPLLIAVEENETVLDNTPEKLQLNNVLRVANYWEALGVIAAHKAGVNPHALRRHGVNHLHRIEGPLLSETSLGALKRLQAAQFAMSGLHSN